MKDISSMSRAALVRELLASSPTTAAETAAAYVENRGSRRSGTRDALVSHKLAVARELLLRDLAERMKSEPVMSAPDTVRDWLRLYCANLEHEVFIILLLDSQNRLIEAHELFRGTLSQTSVYPREVVKYTLARNAAAVVFAHNHPSGVAEPSRADELLTQNLKQALALVDVRFLDHFVVAGTSTVSFAERGLV
jgi:DNA repair protein RadC